MEPRAEIVDLTQRGTNELMNYGVLGIFAILFIIGAVYIFKWAFRKIDEAQTRQDALHAFYGEKIELKEKAHSLEIQRMHNEYTSHMEEISKTVRAALDSNTQAMNDMRTELRVLAEQRGWDGKERRHP